MSNSPDSTRQAMWAAAAVALLMVGQLMASRALRDGFFLTHFEPTALPLMMAGASLFSVAVVFGSTRLLRSTAPARSLPAFFALSALLFGVEWLLSRQYPRVAAVTLYVHTMSVSAVVASAFWSVVNERFDPHTAKRLIGRIAGGASLGGVLGALAVWLGASEMDVPSMLLVLAALNGVCVLGVSQIGEGDSRISTRGTGGADAEVEGSVWDIFQESSYLRDIAALVTLSAFTQALYDYVFKAEAARVYESSAELVSFFALFYLGIGVVTLGVQSLLVRRSLDRFGLVVTVGTLPGIGLLTGFLAVFFPGLVAGIGMRGGTGVVENSLYRSGYELLYTPVLPERKRPTKPLIDVGGDKFGTAAGGGVAFFVIGMFPVIASPLLVFAGIGASVAGLVLMRRLHQGYVGSLAQRLRAGDLDVSEVPVVDATLKIALSDLQAAIDEESRGSLADAEPAHGNDRTPDPSGVDDGMRRDFLAREHTVPAETRSGPVRPTAPRTLDATEIDEALVAIADLRSSDPRRVEAALAGHGPLSRALVGHVIPLLAEAEMADAAETALQRVAAANTGVILDAALQSRTPMETRRRLCDVLGRLSTQRSVNALIELLDDGNFELRFRAATSLLEIRHRTSRLRIPREPLFDVALEEATTCQRCWRERRALDERLSEVPALDSPQHRRVNQGLSFIFTLLLSVLDREPLQLAIRALANHEGGQRGTGLEYLENVLPPRLVQAMRPLLEDDELSLVRERGRREILTELVADSERKPPDLAALRRQIDARRPR